MAAPQSEDDGILREWAPLSGFLKEVPLTVRRGLFLETVALTCIDVVPEYLAVGTNIGVVYWYNRETHEMQRLRPEKTTHKITSVKVVSSVDYMVAAGDNSGTVTVFKIPKPTPQWISSAYKQNTSNSVERYTVGGLHSAPVTALEWSMNGQKLFSGDATGLVVFTEIDYHMNLSKACEILNEKYRVVQLSFNQNAQSLVVATEYRCIVAHRQDNGSWRVVQVGQQERRSLCRVGATFFPHPDRPLQRVIYSGRTGWRFWLSDSEGCVHKTLIFKDMVRKPHQHIRLLHPPPVKDTSWEDLGPVFAWRGTYLVTFNSSTLIILDPQNISVLASLCGLSDLHSVSLTPTEIFIIYGTRNITRLSYIPDLYAVKQEDSGISLLDLKVSPVADTLLDFTSKIKTTATQFVNSRPPTTVNGGVQVMRYLDTIFPHRWIGRRGEIERLCLSPDLTPLDYFYGTTKEKFIKLSQQI
ncbi:WD40 repeats containing protein [Homalodisca vitripennis]|nr:WD40 repeats containing protein [Homalodisca vitripennis]